MIKKVKPGDVIKLKKQKDDKSIETYYDNTWIVEKIYPFHVLARSARIPQIRRCFCYGELVMLGLEWKGFAEV